MGYVEPKPYDSKSVEEIAEIIAEKAFSLWTKNIDPQDTKEGNDLPDYEISKKL